MHQPWNVCFFSVWLFWLLWSCTAFMSWNRGCAAWDVPFRILWALLLQSSCKDRSAQPRTFCAVLMMTQPRRPSTLITMDPVSSLMRKVVTLNSNAVWFESITMSEKKYLDSLVRTAKIIVATLSPMLEIFNHHYICRASIIIQDTLAPLLKPVFLPTIRDKI